jgi:chaperonin GroEL
MSSRYQKPAEEPELTPCVVFQPASARGMQRGVNTLVNVLRPTLGPHHRSVAIDRVVRGGTPELLDSGGVIVRRFLQLPDRDADMGAMFVRHMVWRQHEREGDGTVTLAVLFQAIYNQGVTYLAAGGNAMEFRRHLDIGARTILAELTKQARPVEGQEALSRVAESICFEPALARLLGEIFDIIGEYGRLEIREGRGLEPDREYVEGIYWDGGLLSRAMMVPMEKTAPMPGARPTDRTVLRAEAENAAILLTNLDVQDPEELVPALRAAMDAGHKALVIVARNLSDAAMAVVMRNRDPEKLWIFAVKSPGPGSDDEADGLADMSRLTGATPILGDAKQTLYDVTPAHFGRARLAWANQEYFGIIGGGGDPKALRRHIGELRVAFRRIETADERKKLRARIGKLMGGTATLWVGGFTPAEIEFNKELAERAGDAVRGALLEGVVPGGGVALLNCQPALARLLAQATTPDARAAFRILQRALEEPARVLLENAGCDPSAVMAEVRHAPAGYGFDVVKGEVTDLAAAGVLDPAMVLARAVSSAVTSAGLALTTDVLVHGRKPVQELNT